MMFVWLNLCDKSLVNIQWDADGGAIEFGWTGDIETQKAGVGATGRESSGKLKSTAGAERLVPEWAIHMSDC